MKAFGIATSISVTITDYEKTGEIVFNYLTITSLIINVVELLQQRNNSETEYYTELGSASQVKEEKDLYLN